MVGSLPSLLRPRPERPRDRRAAKRGYEFSPSDVDCHMTLPRGVMLMQWRMIPRIDRAACDYFTLGDVQR